ncbi:MAG: hypothetical protein L0I29_17830 [Hyphomicrobiales bacterium]|nr:hypothetical protein [Hyphomicrobiales bacterium]
MDITLVCGRRPELLQQTLDSFGEKIIANFPSGAVYANIDPFCGTEADGDACEELIRSHFHDVEISRPSEASFGAAVKRLWRKPRSGYFLHMEDDWEALLPVFPVDIEGRLSGNVAQVQMSARNRPYLPHRYSYKTSWINVFGLKIGKRTHFDRPLFSTSPSFIGRDFARRCGEMMDPDKDPEKQLYTDGTELAEFTRGYRNHPLVGHGRRAVVRDLGRPWLAQRGVQKRIVEGTSVWERTVDCP